LPIVVAMVLNSRPNRWMDSLLDTTSLAISSLVVSFFLICINMLNNVLYTHSLILMWQSYTSNKPVFSNSASCLLQGIPFPRQSFFCFFFASSSLFSFHRHLHSTTNNNDDDERRRTYGKTSQHFVFLLTMTNNCHLHLSSFFRL
jgi:sterol desaturase/sphingolipid hydroxylase (fatty acid hydroxylase superfamily)